MKIYTHPKLMYVRQAGDSASYKRVVFAEKNGYYLVWAGAETLSEAENTVSVAAWGIAEDIPEEQKDFEEVKFVPYQLCPKCNGQGQISKPPYIAGDVHEWSSSSCIFPCDVCNGSKIIPMCEIKNK